jgi:hypothetical protein
MRPASPAIPLLSVLALFLQFDLSAAGTRDEEVQAVFACFQLSYQARDVDACGSMFTADFRFHFGDPEGQAAYPQGWGRADELQYEHHLFEGFVNARGQALPAAREISLAFGPLEIRRDPEHPGDREHYALVDARQVVLAIDFGDAGRIVAAGHHAFWLVRSQDGAGEAGRWVIRRWVEEPAEVLLADAAGASDSTGGSDSTAGAVAAAGEIHPARLWTIAPNPSRRGESARLAFEVARDGDLVEAGLYDIAGRRVAVLAHGPAIAGPHSMAWDGRDERGALVNSGVYFARVRVGDVVRRSRIVRIP